MLGESGGQGETQTVTEELVDTVAGVAVMAAALETAAELAERVRDVTRELPFAVDPGGFLVALAVLRWRRGEARLLLAMACVPQSMFPYDQLPLTLLARTRMQSYVFAIWSYLFIWAAWFAGRGWTVVPKVDSLNFLARAIVWGYYLPLVVVVLRRPNVADSEVSGQ